MKDEKRTLNALYDYTGDNGELCYAWFFKILFPEDEYNDTRYTEPVLYRTFRDVFVKSDKWFSNVGRGHLFNFEKGSIEQFIEEPRRKEGEIKDKIRFWNLSYGFLGKTDSSRVINPICHDICNQIDKYTSMLEKRGTLKQNFLVPIESLLNNLRNSRGKRDLISDQSYRLANQIFDLNSNILFNNLENDDYKSVVLKSKVFTETLILCLLFGTIDADGNWDYLQKYIKRRIWGEDTIGFTIMQGNHTMFDSKKCDYGVIDFKRKGRYILNSPGGAGKSYALEYLGAYVNGAEYVNLNEKTLKDKYKLDEKNKNHPKSHLKNIESRVIFLDSLNEIMNNQALYDYMCKDINELASDKTIIVASRYGADVHCTLRGFEECSLVVNIDKDKANKLVDYLSFKNGLEKLLEYPLFYKLAASIYNNDKNNREIEEYVSEENTIRTRFGFFCRYLKSICKPLFEKQGFIYCNLYVLPRLASIYADQTENSEIYRNRISDIIRESTYSDGIYDAEKRYTISNYAKLYIDTALEIIGFTNPKYSVSFCVDDIVTGSLFDSALFLQDDNVRRNGFKHETIHHFFAALDYLVRFKLSSGYVMDGTIEEYRQIFEKNENNLLLNNEYSEIDEFIIDYLEFKESDDFVELYDRITDNICERLNKECPDIKRLKGVLCVLETSVEIAVVLSHHNLLKKNISLAVHKYCSLGVEILHKTKTQTKLGYYKDPYFEKVLNGMLERDLQYYRLYEFEKLEVHKDEFADIYEDLKEYSPVIRNQLYKYEQFKLQKQYQDILGDYSFGRIDGAAHSLKNKTANEGLLKRINSLKSDIDEMMTNLEGNIYEMSCNLLAVMLAYPNLSLLSLGYERDVKKAFVVVARMIKDSERKGTFLQYTYALAYRMLLFDVKIKDSYADYIEDDICEDDLEVREGCISKDERGTISYLEGLRSRCGGLAEDNVRSMQLIEDYLLGNRDIKKATKEVEKREEEKAFERLDPRSKNYLPYMTLKHSVMKNKRGSAAFSLVDRKSLEEKIENDIKNMLKPENLSQLVSFESTNCLYNVMFSLKLYHSLSTDYKADAEGREVNGKDMENLFMELAASNNPMPRIHKIEKMFFGN